MKVILITSCAKQYERLPLNIQKKFDERLLLFQKDPRDPLLRIHKLKGEKKPLKSMNITGDYRALFTQEDKDTITFHEIGTHSQLY